MHTTVSAIYEAGSLQLLEPLALPDATRVQVQVFDVAMEAEHGYRQAEAFHHCLVNLRHLLIQTEQHWSVDLVRQALPHLLRNELKTLWYLCVPTQRKLCAMLELAAKQLDETQLTVEQVGAFRFVLDLLEQAELTEVDLNISRKRLIAVGLPPRFTLDQAVVQSYVDEL